MVASKRFQQQQQHSTDSNAAAAATESSAGSMFSHRTVVQSSTQVTSVIQSTIAEMEEGTISEKELENSIKAFRFHPDRVERMTASPDQIMWIRWEWERESSGDCPEGTILWKEPVMLLPH
mmetsp:Transcript_25529/g.36355  ORF Transcript_25529/g.36355 Transcript_25529/m.36355 type:complete len:121 (+) Transcript_25529:272-634(+)